MAQSGLAEIARECPLSGVKRTTCARGENFHFNPEQTSDRRGSHEPRSLHWTWPLAKLLGARDSRDMSDFRHAMVILAISGSTLANAAEIKVIGGSAVIPAMTDLIPKFEQSSGHKVRTDFDGAIGTMTDRVRKGEVADVVVISGAQIDTLMREGKVVPGSRTDIAKVGAWASLYARARTSQTSVQLEPSGGC